MHFKKTVFVFILLTGLAIACSKDNTPPMLNATGELIDGGSPALDGPGYYIRLDNTEEIKPDFLPDTLKVAGIHLRVKLSYQATEKRYSASCNSCAGMPVVHIVSIQKM